MKRAALLSVSDKTDLAGFARGLTELGFILLSSSGTATILKGEGIEVLPIEQYTGQKEILDGRVKTLHPKIHAGLLAKRYDANHMRQLEEEGIYPIDVAVVNLYPFIEQLAKNPGAEPSKMVEFIDIGGPAMIRAAAKNHSGVLALIDPKDYAEALKHLQSAEVPLSFRRKVASKVFVSLANYNLEIGRYLAAVDDKSENAATLGAVSGVVLTREQELRYGENPHQKAAFYSELRNHGTKSWKQLHGKELSYNNLLDFDAALGLLRCLGKEPTAVIMKHLNPCGVGSGSDLVQALQRAKASDPRSHFGGIIGFNQSVTPNVASEIREGFAEIVLAPSYDEEALKLLRKNPNIRLLQVDLGVKGLDLELRSVEGGILVQQRDGAASKIVDGEVVSKRKPTPQEISALQLAWNICAHVKSNAIVIAKEGALLAVGAGQMSRIDSAEVALLKAHTHKHDLKGAVAASDAFFPFPDAAEKLIEAGVTAIIAPSGAKRDADIVELADRLGVALVFANDRHFRH